MSDQNQAALTLLHTYSLVTHITIQTSPPSISFINLVSGSDSAASSSSFFFLSSSHKSNLTLLSGFQLLSGTFLRAVAQNIPLCRNLRRHLAQIVQDRGRGHNDNAQIYSSSSAQTVTSTKRRKQLMQGPDTQRARAKARHQSCNTWR